MRISASLLVASQTAFAALAASVAVPRDDASSSSSHGLRGLSQVSGRAWILRGNGYLEGLLLHNVLKTTLPKEMMMSRSRSKDKRRLCQKLR